MVIADGKMTIKAAVHSVDRYNFNKGGFAFQGIPDEKFGRLAVVGLAKNSRPAAR